MQLLALRRSKQVTAGHPYFPVLNDFVDGMLSGPLTKEVAAHVESCAGCRDIVADLRELLAAARAEGQQLVRAPGDLWLLVTAVTIHQRALRSYFLSRNRRKLMLGAFLLTLAGAAVGVWLALGCRGAGTTLRAPKCDGAWYHVVRHGAQQRVKELRDYARGAVRTERKRIQRSLSP